MQKKVKLATCILAGLAAGISAANLSLPGYKHASLILSENSKSAVKPLYYKGSGGRQVLAVSVKNRLELKEIGFRMQGALMQSWLPPVVTMPFFKGASFDRENYSGIKRGQNLPLYIVFNDSPEKHTLEVIDPKDNSVITSVNIVKQTRDEKHSH
ncbi:MAG: hypothetical protein LHV68_06240 [Elusimicrobia bacterium]|nr:hypothetical protein [Candidatus Liberimonas magnetica]